MKYLRLRNCNNYRVATTKTNSNHNNIKTMKSTQIHKYIAFYGAAALLITEIDKKKIKIEKTGQGNWWPHIAFGHLVASGWPLVASLLLIGAPRRPPDSLLTATGWPFWVIGWPLPAAKCSLGAQKWLYQDTWGCSKGKTSEWPVRATEWPVWTTWWSVIASSKGWLWPLRALGGHKRPLDGSLNGFWSLWLVTKGRIRESINQGTFQQPQVSWYSHFGAPNEYSAAKSGHPVTQYGQPEAKSGHQKAISGRQEAKSGHEVAVCRPYGGPYWQ